MSAAGEDSVSQPNRAPGGEAEAAAEPGPSLVSVVSVFHNRAPFVRASVESLLAQTWPHLEIFLVDDGSTDETWKELSQFDDPRLIVSRQGNIGFTITLKNLVARSRGRYVAIHGAGDISEPMRIARQAELLDARPEVGVVGCWIRQEALDRSSVEEIRPVRNQGLRRDALVQNPFSHGEVMFRRQDYEKVGGYRINFDYAQDRDLWIRMGRVTDYDIVPEFLYRRLYIPGSVRVSADQRVKQAMLSDFAERCGLAVERGERDLLEAYGGMTPADRAGASKLADRLGRLALKFLVLGHFEAGAHVARAGFAQRVSPMTVAAQLAVMATRWPRLWRCAVAPLLRLAMRRRPRSLPES